MKKIVTLIFLPVFLFGILGWQGVILLRLSHHHEQERLKDVQSTNLEIILVDKANSENTFFINDHELIQNGKLFDVKYKEGSDNNMVCYCERDNDEEDILTSLDVHTKNYFDNFASTHSKIGFDLKLSVFETTEILTAPEFLFGLDQQCTMVMSSFHASAHADSFFVPPEIS